MYTHTHTLYFRGCGEVNRKAGCSSDCPVFQSAVLRAVAVSALTPAPPLSLQGGVRPDDRQSELSQLHLQNLRPIKVGKRNSSFLLLVVYLKKRLVVMFQQQENGLTGETSSEYPVNCLEQMLYLKYVLKILQLSNGKFLLPEFCNLNVKFYPGFNLEELDQFLKQFFRLNLQYFIREEIIVKCHITSS